MKAGEVHHGHWGRQLLECAAFSRAAPGLLASVAPHLGVHHDPWRRQSPFTMDDGTKRSSPLCFVPYLKVSRNISCTQAACSTSPLGRWREARLPGLIVVRHSAMALAFKTTFEVFTRVGPDNSLERLTERSVGLVTDRPSNVYELLVTLL